jgi:[acyl-carrier-protein] S-malonyltransferase
VIAFIFPGQNSQYVGMGEDLYDASTLAREVMEAADRALDIDLLALMFDGPEAALTQTENQQPAILTHSLAALAAAQERGLKPGIVAGHSLGEYSALVAAGVLGTEDAVALIRFRAEVMAEAAADQPGAMSAILGLDAEPVETIVEEAGQEGVCRLANYNCPGQVVISGSVPAIERAEELASEAGAKRVIRLRVSGAFHTPLMATAAERLIERLRATTLQPAQVPVVSNVDATARTDPGQIRDALGQQMLSSVLWEQSVRAMRDAGADTLVEIGPGTVLSRLVRRTDRTLRVLNVEDQASLELTLEALT